MARSRDGGVRFDAAVEDAALVDAGAMRGMARYRHGGREALLFTNGGEPEAGECVDPVERGWRADVVVGEDDPCGAGGVFDGDPVA